MSFVTLVAIYFVVWWTVLFAVLPWGVRSQEEEGEVILGTERSSPVRPMLVRKAVATSIVAAVVVFFIWLAAHLGVSLEGMADYFNPPRP
jgi:predicted secreted protein